MIKRYYVEEIDGKETKRTLTTFNDLDDMCNYSDIELQEMFYEVSGELVSKSKKFNMLAEEMSGREELGESDFSLEFLRDVNNNIEVLYNELYK